MLKGTLPLHSVRFYSTTIAFEGYQMRDFVDERNQESIFVERSIDGNQVQSVGQSAVIPVPCNPMIHNFQVHPMGFDQFKTRSHCKLWKIFLKGHFHHSSIENGHPSIGHLNFGPNLTSLERFNPNLKK